MADELLKEFVHQIASLTLLPSSGGRFEVKAGDTLLFSKKALGRHAEPGEVARLLRVEVVRLSDRTELFVRDVSRPPAADVVKPTDPWDKPGFDPKDRKADPSRFA